MDHSPFEGLFKTLLPIVIFIIWAVASGSAQKRKKEQDALRRRRMEETERERQTEAESEGSSEEAARPQAAKQEEWKRSIEDMLEEMGLPVERKPAPPPAAEPVELKGTPSPEEDDEEEESQSLEDLEPEVIPEKPIDETMKAHLAAQESAYTLSASPIDNQRAYSTGAIESIPAGASGSLQKKTQTEFDIGDLKKFIVWSELLGKPVTLRDEEKSSRFEVKKFEVPE